MGLIQFVGTESLPTQDTGGFTRLSRQPDGQGEQYQPLDLPLDMPPVVEEISAKEPVDDTEEQSLPDVVEQLHAFTHMPPVFVRHEEASRLLAARQQPDAERGPAVAFTEGSKERPVLLTGDVARGLNQSVGQSDKQPLPDKLIANLQSLLGDRSERDPFTSDFKTVAGQLPAAPLTRAAEYQWAPARLADSPAQWGQQLVDVLKDKVELQVNQSIKQAHIRLDPPELGRLELTVRVEGDRLNVQLNVTNPAVREALIQSMERLRMSLAPHHAGGVEVNVGQGGEQERGERWQQQDKILAGRRQWGEDTAASDGPAQEWLNTLV
ncbi:MAG: flagellar hook-length control protein FliK [Aeromonas sp.]|uniref:flagellar hook-length control protein FliK n=1 Tax=Aeromonas sp. TaxID=647 RepID=UPI002FC6256C